MHGPHHVATKWADKYKGKFSDGWDAYQERVFEKQKAMGWIPADTIRPPRPAEMPAWKDLPAEERAFQERLMEVYAGFLEHTDVQVGKLIDELEARGIRDNTLVIYLLFDNGASAEGMNGSVAELDAQNLIPSTVADHIAVAEKLGGLKAIQTLLKGRNHTFIAGHLHYKTNSRHPRFSGIAVIRQHLSARVRSRPTGILEALTPSISPR